MKAALQTALKHPLSGVLLLALLAAPLHAEQSARELLDKSLQRAASETGDRRQT